MRRAFHFTLPCLLSLFLFVATTSHVHANDMTAEAAAVHATSLESSALGPATDRLRELGPEGLTALAKRRDQLVKEMHAAEGGPRTTVLQLDIDMANAAMDAVAQQRYGHVSRLYWYTDLDAALAEAKEQNKPVLSLQMLGKLTEEYSCANSRFFRVLLYADPQVSDYLRENYVLHWRSVRDVPVVTISLADGSTLKRTITGNSAHFVLDSEGHTLNIIPGLWHASAFLEEIQASHALASYVAAQPSHWKALTAAWHKQRLERDQQALSQKLKELDMAEAQLWQRLPAMARRPVAPGAPMLIVGGKGIVEAPILKATDLSESMVLLPERSDGDQQVIFGAQRVEGVSRLLVASDRKPLRALASGMEYPQPLAERVLQLITGENPLPQYAAPSLVRHDRRVPDDLTAAQHHLRRRTLDALATDTFLNRYGLQNEVHNWFIHDVATELEREPLVKLTYNVLFMMDLNDPWAGLYDPTVFTGLQDGGITIADTVTPAAITAKRE